MRKELGLDFTALTADVDDGRRWDDYATLKNPPAEYSITERPVGASIMYKGIVPARNIFKRDFAVNGSSVSSLCQISSGLRKRKIPNRATRQQWHTCSLYLIWDT